MGRALAEVTAILSGRAALLVYLSSLIVQPYFIYLETAGDIEITPSDTKLVKYFFDYGISYWRRCLNMELINPT